MDDVARQDVARGRPARLLVLRPEQPRVVPVEDGEQSFAAKGHVILEDVDAVDGGNGENGVAFVFHLASPVAGFHHPQLARQNLDQEIARAAGRLQKARVDAFGLLPDKVEHGIDLALGGVDLAVVDHALFGDDLSGFWV